MYEYKVLTERDKRLTGGFDPDTLEATLNSYAVPPGSTGTRTGRARGPLRRGPGLDLIREVTSA